MNASRSSEHELRVIWNTALEAFVVLDDARRYLAINEAASRMLGSARETVLQRRVEDYTPREYWGTLDRQWADWEAEGTHQGQGEVLRGDGSRTMVEYRATWNFAPGRHLIAAWDLGVRGSRLPEGGPWRAAGPLTLRQREVLQLAAEGLRAPDIAAALSRSTPTVKTHLQDIYARLGVQDRAAAVAEALRRGLID